MANYVLSTTTPEYCNIILPQKITSVNAKKSAETLLAGAREIILLLFYWSSTDSHPVSIPKRMWWSWWLSNYNQRLWRKAFSRNPLVYNIKKKCSAGLDQRFNYTKSLFMPRYHWELPTLCTMERFSNGGLIMPLNTEWDPLWVQRVGCWFWQISPLTAAPSAVSWELFLRDN